MKEWKIISYENSSCKFSLYSYCSICSLFLHCTSTQGCIQGASLCLGHTDHDFGRTKSKHWHPIGFKKICFKFGEWNPSECIQIVFEFMYSNANQTPTFEILDTTLSTVVFSLFKDCQNETSLTHSTDEGKRVHVSLRKSFQAVLRVTFVFRTAGKVGGN